MNSNTTHRDPLLADPLLPDIPDLLGLSREDHLTFVAPAEHEREFVRYWTDRAFVEAPPYTPTRYPARHIALVLKHEVGHNAKRTIGLSVSDDPRSPINRCIQLYGGFRIDDTGVLVPGRLQHLALAVTEGQSIELIRASLESQGVRFMTPVLCYADSWGAFLKQMFVACRVPYGPFVEIVHRGTNRNGAAFQGFSSEQIDTLYEYYDRYSKSLVT